MQPLDNLKVLDLSRLAAGNMVSHMFADFGADVIKIERPGKGDDLRNWKVNGVSPAWGPEGFNPFNPGGCLLYTSPSPRD